jgi:hypothetical protein
MSKMGSHDPFWYLKHKYDQMKGWESNCQFDIQPLKLGNCPNSLACRLHATYRWKALNKGYNFAWKLISIKGFHTKLWDSKVAKIPFLGILKFPLGSFGTKWHLGANPMVRHRVYYKGEGGSFPQVRAMVNLVNLCLFVVSLCTKSAAVMH